MCAEGGRERERESELRAGKHWHSEEHFFPPRIGAELTDRREPWGVGLRAKGPRGP